MNKEKVVTNKKSKALLISSMIVMIIDLIFLAIFINALIEQQIHQNLSSAFGLVLTLIFIFIPGVIISLVGFTLSFLSFKSVSKPRPIVYKVSFIISIIIPIVYCINFILLYIK